MSVPSKSAKKPRALRCRLMKRCGHKGFTEEGPATAFLVAAELSASRSGSDKGVAGMGKPRQWRG